jgi:hypothetical protein
MLAGASFQDAQRRADHVWVLAASGLGRQSRNAREIPPRFIMIDHQQADTRCRAGCLPVAWGDAPPRTILPDPVFNRPLQTADFDGFPGRAGSLETQLSTDALLRQLWKRDTLSIHFPSTPAPDG